MASRKPRPKQVKTLTGDPATPERPIYEKVPLERNGGNFYLITCDEGWRKSIVAAGMYENVADWLLDILGRKPYVKKEASDV